MSAKLIQHQANDSSVQAMTEVALGLSMAFFAILIVALVSINLSPNEQASDKQNTLSEVTNEAHESLLKNETVNLNLRSLEANESDTSYAESEQPTSQKEKSSQFLFYFDGHFYNEELEPILVSQLNSQWTGNFNSGDVVISENLAELILALPPLLDLQTALSIKQKVLHPNMSITQMSEQWLDAIKQKQALQQGQVK